MLFPQQNPFRNILDLSGIWDFQTDPDQCGERQGWPYVLPDARPIAVPGSWNEQYEDLYNYLGLAWYVQSTYIPQSWRGQRVFLRVGSASYFATVYCNGVKIGLHEGGHLPFAFEITEHIRWQSENSLAISVENELKPTRVPSGNISTPLLPIASFPQTTFDFFPFAGIHRPVVLFCVPDTYIEDLTVVTGIDGTTGTVNVSVRLNAEIQKQGTVHIEDGETVIEAALTFNNGIAEALLIVPNALFWSDKRPYLYDLTVRTEQDQYALKIGIRTVAVRNGQILLNGEPVRLKGFGRHEDFIASGKGLNLPLLIKDYQLMRWTGANSYRTSHYPYSEEEMQLADREGFLIIAESPAVSLQFEDDAHIAARLPVCLRQIDELVARDKNHPSVLIWSVANEPMLPRFNEDAHKQRQIGETKGKAFLDQLLNHIRALDSSRLATFAHLGGSPESWLEACDAICINRYWGWYVLGGELDKALAGFDQELEALWHAWQKPVIVTEFGADTVAGLHGHPNLMWTEEYQADYLRGHLEVAADKPYVVGMQVWAFADFAAVQSILRVGGINRKGVFTRERTPKLAVQVLRKFWTSQ